jgi:hypothetical protein
MILISGRRVQVVAYAVWNLMAGFIITKPRVPGDPPPPG